MYKIMIHIDTHTNDTWFYYQEEGKDYVANSLEEIRETVLTLIDVYGEDYIKIVKQETGDDMNGSVETFLYDSTDNYEELVNRPFINGVEIVGALSLAELGIQPVGNYATNERVDALEETVNNIDFTPYATNARVDQVEYKVDNIDLTPYATNERVDQVEAKVDAIDLEPYATMDYLDEVVAGIDFSASNENITGVKTFSVLPRSTVMPVTEDELTNKSYVDHEVLGCATEEYVDNAVLAAKKSQIYQLALTDKIPTSGRQLTSAELSELSKICNSILTLNDTQAQIQLYLKNDKYIGFLYPEIEYLPTEKTIYDVLKSTRTKYLQGKLGCATYPANTNYGFFDVTMTITGTYNSSTNQISITKAAIQSNVNNHVYNVMGISKSYLSKTNTTSFTPTANYHPATKLYVDNAVAKIEIPEVNLDGYATTEYVDNAIANIDVPDVDLTNYYNKEEVNSLVEDPTKRRIYNVEFNMSGGSDILGPNTLNQIGEMITNWYKTSERSMLMFASFWSGNNDGIRYAYIYQGLYTWNTGSYYDKTTGLNYQNKVFQFNKLSDNAGKVFDSVSIRMEGTWDNDVYTCTKCAFTVGTDLAAEIKTIKNDYAKTADVTTMINAAIGNVLEGGY